MVQFQIPLSSSERNPADNSWSRRWSLINLRMKIFGENIIWKYYMKIFDENIWWKYLHRACRLAERAAGRTLGDFGEPQDIAEAAAFLASSKARFLRKLGICNSCIVEILPNAKLDSVQYLRYMNGATVDVNGGLLWANTMGGKKSMPNKYFVFTAFCVYLQELNLIPASGKLNTNPSGKMQL